MLNAQTAFLISLFLLLACALVAGEIALRLGQLALVGQLLVGVALGPTLLGPSIGLTSVSPELSAVQILATFFLLFLAGMEMGPRQISSMRGKTLGIGLGIFFVPFLAILFLAHTVDPTLSLLTLAFVAVTLSITALPVMAVMVRELGLIDRELGQVVMSAALVNELSAVTLFAVLLQIHDAGQDLTWTSIATALLAIALFLVVIFAAHFVVKHAREFPRLRRGASRLSDSVRSQEAGFAILMILSLGAALLSQSLGLTFVIGAFYAGLLVTPQSVGPELYESLRKVLRVFMWGLFVPLFFAITGIQTNLRLLVAPSAGIAFAALLGAAILAKVGTGAILARWKNWSMPDSVAFGFLVNSRGAVEIAMAVILFTTGILTAYWFSLIVAVGLVCTVLAPMGAVAAWKSTAASRAELFARAPRLARRPISLTPGDETLDASPGPPA